MLKEARSPHWPAPIRALIAGMVVLALALLGVAGSPARQAQAAPPDGMERHKLATYNTQGSKWDEVSQLMARNDIVAIQESGVPVPVHQHNPAYRTTPNRRGFQAGEYRWGDWWLYYLPQPGAGNRRTGMTIVTRTRAEEFDVLINNDEVGTRGSVGVRIGSTWYYTIHANPGHRRDSPLRRNETAIADSNAFVERVAVRSRQQGHEWVVMGDFNINLQDPQNLPGGRLWVPPTGYLYRTGLPTHQEGGELDYMVGSRRVDGYGAQRLNGAGSDHYGVEFRPNLVASGDHGGRVYNLHKALGDLNVDVWGGNEGEQAGLDHAYPHHLDSHQNFTVVGVPQVPGWVQFRSSYGDKRCLGLGPAPNVGVDHVSPIVSQNCDTNNPGQQFLAHTNNASEWQTSDGRHVTVSISTPRAGLLAAPATFVPLRLD